MGVGLGKPKLPRPLVASQTAPSLRQHRSQRRSLRGRTFIPYLFLSPAILLFPAVFHITFWIRGLAKSVSHPTRRPGSSAPHRCSAVWPNYQKVFVDPVFIRDRTCPVSGLIEAPILGSGSASGPDLDGAALRLHPFFAISFFLPLYHPSFVATLLWVIS